MCLLDLIFRGANRNVLESYTCMISIYLLPRMDAIGDFPSGQCRSCESCTLWIPRALSCHYLVIVPDMCESVILHCSFCL